MATTFDTDTLDEVLLEIDDLIESKVNEFLDAFTKSGKTKVYTYTDATKKQNAINFFLNDTGLNIKAGAIAAATAKNIALASDKKIRKKKLAQEINKAIDTYLNTVIDSTKVDTAYNNTAPVPSATTGPPVATTLATPTPVTATGTPIVTTTTATSTASAYEIILDTDKMKFFVYNIFAHDLAHDLFPVGLGEGRVNTIEQDQGPTSDIYKFLNRKPTYSSDVVYYGGKSYMEYMEEPWKDDETKNQDKEEEEEKTAIKEMKNKKEEDLFFTKNFKEDNLSEDEDVKNTIEKIEEDKIKEENKIIVDRGAELTKDIIKSVGLTLEQRGTLFVKIENVSRKRMLTTTKNTFIIIDVKTIKKDYNEFLTNDYENTPIYPGYIYYDKQVISPYDITVKKDESNNTYVVTFNVGKTPITIVIQEDDNFYIDKESYIKIELNDKIGVLSFKEAYNQIDNAYDVFRDLFYNYIIREASDGSNSDFNIFYPQFLLKKKPKTTRNKFIELMNDLNEENFKKYYHYYEPKFKCFQGKVCNFLQKKHESEEAEILKKIEKAIDFDNSNAANKGLKFPPKKKEEILENFKSDFSATAAKCTEYDFMSVLAKMFAHLIEAETNDPNGDSQYKTNAIDKISTIITNFIRSNPFNNNKEQSKPNDFIQFFQLVILYLNTYYEDYTKKEQTGGDKSNTVVNSTNIICTSVHSIMYYLNKVTAVQNKMVDVELEICNNMIQKGIGAGIDDYLFDSFYTWINMTSYSGDVKYYNNNNEKSLPKISFDKKAAKIASIKKSSAIDSSSLDTVVGLPEKADFWEWLDISPPADPINNLFFISNAADAPNQLPSGKTKESYLKEWTGKSSLQSSYEKAEEDNKTTKFCPFSSIIDGQPSCSKFISPGDIKEKGTLFVTVRNLPAGSNDPNEMVYTVKVEPKPNDATGKVYFGDEYNASHIVLVHVLLKIGGVRIINYGTLDELTATTDKELMNDPAIEIDLDDSTSYLDAKDCMIRLINLNIGLLKDKSSKARSWEFLMRKIKSDNITSGTTAIKMPFQLHTPGTVSTYTNQDYTSDQLRQKILRTSVTKSLGDYTQELNMVTKNSGYVGDVEAIKKLKGTPKKYELDDTTKIRKVDDLRLGFSKDRPSGVRLLLLKLFGKERTGNKANSGTNERSIVGYYDTLGKAFIAYQKDKFPSTTNTSLNYASDFIKESNALYKKGGNKNNNTKRNKGGTKKIKKLFKNRKISKRNNKGTRKRK